MQLNAAEHIPEFIENAILTHAEPTNHGSQYNNTVYTFFAAARDNGIQPVKLKVKSFDYTGQQIPANIQEYFDNNPEAYDALYDLAVLELDNIEEDLSGSAKSLTANAASIQGPDGSLTISVADLIRLVNNKYQKYIPHDSARMNPPVDDGQRFSVDDSQA